MVNPGTIACPEQESAGCHFGTLEETFLGAKNKMAAGRLCRRSEIPNNFLIICARKLILVSTPMFSGSRSSFIHLDYT